MSDHPESDFFELLREAAGDEPVPPLRPPGGAEAAEEPPGGLRNLLGARVGPFRLRRVLGEGAMGVVYEAEQATPRRVVALKIVRPEVATPETLGRFERELHALARLSHAGIAQIYEAGTLSTVQGPRPFFAMELVNGTPLTDFAARRQLSVRQRLELIARVAEAVHHAHQRGIIHRDLKPANVLVVAEEGAGPVAAAWPGSLSAGAQSSGARSRRGAVELHAQPKVLDFGLALVSDADVRLTRADANVGQIIGTLAYMSPEQAAGDPDEIDTRSDVYSLGVMLFELLAGQLPYELHGRRMHEALRIIVDHAPLPLSAVSRALRGDVATIVGKALEKDRERRYASAAALADDIRRYLNDEPIEARPASIAYTLRKLARRHRGLVAGSAIVAGLLIYSVVVTGVLYLSEAAQRKRAEDVTSFVFFPVTQLLYGAAEGGGMPLDEDVLSSVAQWLERSDLSHRPELEAAVRAQLGRSFYLRGNLAAASPHLERALEIRRGLHEEDHPSVAASVGDLALLRLGQRRLDEAQELIEQQLELLRGQLPEAHPKIAEALDHLGSVHSWRGEVEEAVRHYRAALAIRRQIWPGDHVEVAESLNNLGWLLESKGRLEEAEQPLAEAYAMKRRLYTLPHRSLVETANNLGRLYRAREQYAQAERFFQQALADARQLEDSLLVAIVARNLGGMLVDLERFDEAEPLLVDSHDRIRALKGSEHADTLYGAVLRARVHLGRGELAAAEPLLTEAVEKSRGVQATDYHWVAVGELGELRRLQQRYGEAESSLRAAVEGLEKGGASPRAILRVAERLVALYEQWQAAEPGESRAASIETWRARVAELRGGR